MTTTPLMSLVLPTNHGSAEVWDVILETVFQLIDGHDHTTGKGGPVPTGGLKIDADISWSFGGVSRAITDIKALDFSPQAAADMTLLAGALFLNSADNELYYRTTGGSNVKLTSGSALNVAAFVGGIGGDYSAISALLDYDDATDTYRFRQETAAAVRQFAKMRCADLQLVEYDPAGDASVPAFAVTLKSPDALAAAYDVTWPAAVPGSTQLMQMSSAGALTASNTVVNSLTMAANQHVTVSGTGEFKHGQRTLVVGAAAFTPGNNFSPANINYGAASNIWQMGAAPNDSLGADVPLIAGDRIVNMTWHFNKNSSASGMTFALNTRNGTTVTNRDTHTDVNNGPAFTSVNRMAINYTLVSGDSTWLQVASSNAAHQFSHCVITYDHP